MIRVKRTFRELWCSRISLIITITLIAFLFNVIVVKSQATGDSHTIAVVYFSSPVKLDETYLYLNSPKIKLTSFRRQYVVGGKVVADEYYINSKQPDWLKIKREYWEAHYAMLQDMFKDDINNYSFATEKSKTDWDARSNQFKEAIDDFSSDVNCWKTNSCPDLYIISVQISGPANEISSMRITSGIFDIKIQQNAPFVVDINQSVSSAFIDPLTWLPSEGYLRILPSSLSQNQRYISNHMYWDTAGRLSGFQANSTYEHDFFSK